MPFDLALRLVRISNIIVCLAGVYPAIMLLRMNWHIRREPSVSDQTRTWLWWLGLTSILAIAVGGVVWVWLFFAVSGQSLWPGIVYALNTVTLDVALYTLIRLSRHKG